MEPPESAPELLRAWPLGPELRRLPAGGGAEILHAPGARAGLVVGPERLRVLLSCQGFATLDQHAARLAAETGRAAEAIRVDLAELSRAGLLASAGELMQRLAGHGEEPEPPRVATLGIPTRDRAPELEAALSSYLANARGHGRTLDFVIGDDGVTAAERAATRAVAAALSARHHVPISYVGRAERERYAMALAAHAGVPRAVVDFALVDAEGCESTVGQNQNAILLHGVGAPLIQVDDDTRCRLAPAPGQLPGLSLTSQGDPTELWFPAAGAPDLPDRVLVDRDYVSLHEALLGRSVSGCVAGARRLGLDLDHAGSALFRRLEARGGRVACTQTGAAGDSGTGSMWHYLLLGDPSRRRLLAAEAGYRHAFTGRRVVRAARRAAVSDGSFCMSMSLGLDARTLLPPFFPVLRNGDGVFGAVLRAAFADTFTGFLPWVVEHAPALPRTSPFEAFFASLGRVGAGDLLCLLVSASGVEADPGDPARSLAALGEALERWGSLPPADFEEIVRIQALRARSVDLCLLDEALHRHGRAPAFWARDVERAIAALQAALPEPWLAHPTDLVASHGEAGRTVFQRLVRRHGALLRAWPDLFAAALDLGERGVRPGVAVSP